MNWLRFGKRENDSLSVEPFLDMFPSLYILHPSTKRPGSTLKQTTTVSGRFDVELKEEELFQSVECRLYPKYFASNGTYTDRGELEGQTCRLQANATMYRAGKNSFPFIFEVPCDAVVYTDFAMQQPDWVDHGKMYRIRYLLEISITRCRPGRPPQVYKEAWPPWAKPIGTIDPEAAHLLPTTKRFHVVPSPADPGELPPSLSAVLESITPELGFVRIHASSRYFVIGGLITINFNISPASDAKIQQIRCILRETVAWRSPKEGGPAWSEKPRKYEFLTFNAEEQRQHSSDTIHLTKTTRLPDDYRASRSSLRTVPQLLTTEHELLFEIEYVKNSHKFVGTLAKPVILAGCEMISESIRPPTYGSNPMSDEDLQPDRLADLREGRNGYVYCTCGFSMDMLLQREMEGLSSETSTLLLPKPEKPAAQKSAAVAP